MKDENKIILVFEVWSIMKDSVWCDMKDRNIVLMTAQFSLGGC